MSKIALLSLCAVFAAGCGAAAEPRLAQPDAAQLISLSQRIAREGACAQKRDIPRLHDRAIALINAGRVPQELQEPLMSGVGALSSQTPVCLANVTPVATSTTPAQPSQGDDADESPPAKPAKPKGHGHGKGHAKHGKKKH
jgi:hypothetical protein